MIATIVGTMKSKKTKVNSMAAVGKAFGRHRTTVQLWKTLDGFPDKGPDGKYDLEAIAVWRNNRSAPDHRSLATKEDSDLTKGEFENLLEDYSVNRIKHLITGQIKRKRLSERMIDSIQNLSDAQIELFDLRERMAVVRACDLGMGILYDKEFKEKGEGKDNVNVIVVALKDLKRRKFEKLKSEDSPIDVEFKQIQSTGD
jgi:hypothetical protein